MLMSENGKGEPNPEVEPVILVSATGQDGRLSVDGETLDPSDRWLKWRDLMDSLPLI